MPIKSKKPESTQIIPVEVVERRIFLIRGHKVMLDSDLAQLYGVETKALNRAVKRNLGRFPEDFMFQLTAEETKLLRFHSGTSKTVRGGRRYHPYAFTEQGVSMLSSVLHQLDPRYEHLRVRNPQRQRRLMASLAASGQQTPIVVVAVTGKPNRYLVIDGYKRVAALEQLPVPRFFAVIDTPGRVTTAIGQVFSIANSFLIIGF